jgi:hypothetical protein
MGGGLCSGVRDTRNRYSRVMNVVVRAPIEFGLQQVPVPEGSFLLVAIACGICGSDLRTLRSASQVQPSVDHRAQDLGNQGQDGVRLKGRWQVRPAAAHILAGSSRPQAHIVGEYLADPRMYVRRYAQKVAATP